jgi:transposase
MLGDSHTPTIMPNTMRRIEVITGVERRRRWSAEEKTRIVAESYEPSTTVSEVARRHGLNANQLFAWRHQFRQATGVGVNPHLLPQFVPLVATAEEAPTGPTATLPTIAPIIEIIAGVLTVRVPAGIDEATLRQVLGVVRSLA